MTSSPATADVDAVVVGAGATGAVAALALSEAGMRVLLLEAGPDLKPDRARGSEPLNSLRRLSHLASGRQRLQANHPGFWKHNPELFIDERLHPYSTPPDAPFLWTRGRQVGGRSLTWGGITLRLSDHEFAAAQIDGHGPCWPIRHADLDPYYTRLERLLGIHGHADGLEQLPDGVFLPALPFTPGERHLKQAIAERLGLPLIHSRGFALHRPSPGVPWPPSSAQGILLPRAFATNRVQLRSEAVVSHLEMDRRQERVEAVVIVNSRTGSSERIRAPLVVLCASTIESVRILLHSWEGHRQGGWIDPSGCLGRYLMDHISSCRFFSLPDIAPCTPPAELSGAGSCFIPNTRHLGGADGDPGFLRGYGIWAAIQRFDPPRLLRRSPQEAAGFLIGHGEVLASAENRVTLDGSRLDVWGLPIPHISCRWGSNEQAMARHMQARMEAVVAAAGGQLRPVEDLFVLPLVEPLVKGSWATSAKPPPPGYYIHELGGARMSLHEQAGVVNPWNQCWRAPNLLVTDGSCWPSAGWQSPTLTAMAITWRACEAAAARLRQG